MLRELLIKFGLTESESRTYEALAEADTLSVQALSKVSGIPRTSLYGILEGLSERGLVLSEMRRGGAVYRVAGAEAFSREISVQRESLHHREEVAHSLASLLPTLQGGRGGLVPTLQFVEGKKAVENLLYHSIPHWRDSYERLDHYVMWGYQDHTFVEQYRKWHDYAWKTRGDREEIKLFSDSAAVRHQQNTKVPRREIKLLPEGIEFPSSVWVHGDYLVLAMTRVKPHYAFQIHDISLSAVLRTVFQLLWRLS